MSRCEACRVFRRAYQSWFSTSQAYRSQEALSSDEVSGQRAFRAALFDHLVNTSAQGPRHFEAERLQRLEIDDQLEFGRPHDRQIGGFLALENPASVDAGLSVCVGEASAVAHQAARIDKFASKVGRGNH